MSLFISADFHQGDERFNVHSRGKQHAFMSLSALLTARNVPLSSWSKITFNNVLLQGDKLYLKALNTGFIVLDPGIDFLSVEHLPKVISTCTNMSKQSNDFSYEICQSMIDTVSRLYSHVQTADENITTSPKYSDLPVVVEPFGVQNNITGVTNEAQVTENGVAIELPTHSETISPMWVTDTTDSPIVVKPIEAQSNSDSPIVVKPIEAQASDSPIVVKPIVVQPVEAQNNIDLPIVVKPIVAPSKIDLSLYKAKNINQTWYINYEKELQGLVITDREIESFYYDIHTALVNTFANDCFAILILEGYMMALMKETDNFYLFDSHARDSSGIPDPNGTAVVMTFTNIIELEQHVYCLSMELRTNSFEIVPV